MHGDYPKDPAFRQKYGPRGVLHTRADGKGGQTIQDTGPHTRQRMETVDGEIFAAAETFIDRLKELESLSPPGKLSARVV